MCQARRLQLVAAPLGSKISHCVQLSCMRIFYFYFKPPLAAARSSWRTSGREKEPSGPDRLLMTLKTSECDAAGDREPCCQRGGSLSTSPKPSGAAATDVEWNRPVSGSDRAVLLSASSTFHLVRRLSATEAASAPPPTPSHTVRV